MIGAAKSAQTFTAPFRNTVSRLVLVHQHRIVNDYPLAAWIAKRIVPDISLHWVLDAQTCVTEIPITHGGELSQERDRQGMLRGRVQLLATMDDDTAKTKQKQAVSKIDGLLRTGLDKVTHLIPEKHDQSVRIVHYGLRRQLRASPTIKLEFGLMRTGECRIWYSVQPQDIPEDQLDWVAEQAYYFIKDIVHDHTHHDATSDQITPLYRFGRHFDEPGHDDEVAWRRETLWSLSREIERLNREAGLTDQRKSLGIIAFAEAFQASLMGHVRTHDSAKPFEKSTSVHDYDFKHLKDSIKASIDVNSTKLTQKVQVSIAALTVFIASTSLVSSLIGTHNGALEKVTQGRPKGTIDLGGLEPWIPTVSANPVMTGFAAMVSLLGLIAYFLLDGRAGIYNRAQRFLSQIGRALAVTWFDSLVKQWLFLLLYHLGLIGLTLFALFICFGIVIAGTGL